MEPEYIFEDNIDYIELVYKINLSYESAIFKEHLDTIPLAIFDVIKLIADELLVQVSEKHYNDFETYFRDDFLKEYDNEYFEFKILEESDKYRFKIKILKVQ